MTPFCFFSFILFDLLLDCKCAIFLLDRAYRSLDLSQHHFGNIGNGAAELHYRVFGVEYGNTVEVLPIEILPWVISEAHHCTVDNRRGCLHYEKTSLIGFGQGVQLAKIVGGKHDIEIVLVVIVHNIECDSEQGFLKLGVLCFAEMILQFFQDAVGIFRLDLPERERLVVPAVGVRNIEYMPKMRAIAAVVDQRDALCPAVDPAVKHRVP